MLGLLIVKNEISCVTFWFAAQTIRYPTEVSIVSSLCANYSNLNKILKFQSIIIIKPILIYGNVMFHVTKIILTRLLL